MAQVLQQLFSWQDVESSPDILRLQRVLQALPDGPLIEALERMRAGRRNDYPLVAMWHSFIAALMLDHRTHAGLLRELRRNGELRMACGFDPVLGAEAVPSQTAFSRFVAKLVRLEHLVDRVFDDLLERLCRLLPGLGRHLAVDGKAIPAADRSDPEGDLGIKSQTNADGTISETFRWFGYKLHMLIDAVYELPLAFMVTRASEGESPRLPELLSLLKEKHPAVIEAAEDLAGDKAYDSAENKEVAYDEHGIVPLIPVRHLAKAVHEPLNPGRHDTIYISPVGELCCKVVPNAPDPKAEFCQMQFQGHEPERGTLKFRCPAAALGATCRNQQACHSQTRDQGFGRVVRVDLDRDRRKLMPVPSESRTFKTRYARRTSVERFFSRLDHFYGFERHTMRGLSKVRLRIAVALLAVLATALSWIEAGQPERVRCKFQTA